MCHLITVYIFFIIEKKYFYQNLQKKLDYQYRILFYVVMKIKYLAKTGDAYPDRGDRVQILRTEFQK